MAPRLAVYAVPPAGHPLEGLAAAWLGRAARPGAVVPPLPDWLETEVNGAERAAMTASPRRYGFHGTLRAPVALAPGAAETDFHHATAALAARWRPFAVPLAVGALGSFLALLPSGGADALDRLHREALAAVEPLREPPGAAERARRLATGLTDRQVANLDRWGYPHVMDDFRFHMTLTGPLAGPDRDRLATLLARLFAPALSGPVPFDCLAVFREAAAEDDFTEVARHPFAGARGER